MFKVFGSEDSQDLDVMIFLDELPKTTLECAELCKFYNKSVSDIYTDLYGIDKEVNCNLAVLSGGVIAKVFKGTSDEVNNSILLTQGNHTQFHKNDYITRNVERDLQIKLLRTARVLLSFLSRTKHRPKAKAALKGDIYHKISCLKEINLSLVDDIGKQATPFEDYLKTMSFQLGQTLALNDGVELFCKNSIGERYPELVSFLSRDVKSDLNVLEKFKKRFCKVCEDFEFTTGYEYKV